MLLENLENVLLYFCETNLDKAEMYREQMERRIEELEPLFEELKMVLELSPEDIVEKACEASTIEETKSGIGDVILRFKLHDGGAYVYCRRCVAWVFSYDGRYATYDLDDYKEKLYEIYLIVARKRMEMTVDWIEETLMASISEIFEEEEQK